MSYEQLMVHAAEIQRLATAKALEDAGVPEGETLHPHQMPLDVAAERRRLAEQQRQQITTSFADIPDLFRPYADMPRPEAFQPVIQEMRDALEQLAFNGAAASSVRDPGSGEEIFANEQLLKMSGIADALDDWSGAAAMEFKYNFVDPFPAWVTNQFIVASVLKGALEAYQAMWVEARNNIDDIAHKTIAALENMDDCGKNTWSITFSVVAAVFTVGAALPMAAGEAVGVAIVGAASSVAAATPPKGLEDRPPGQWNGVESSPSIEFNGETPEAVVNAMREAIRTLTQYIAGQQRKIADALRQTQRAMGDARSSFVVKRPALAGATARTITSSQFMGFSS